MKETQLQIKLPGVPLAKQGREIPSRWEWTEAVVWNERMLATLERGIKGGKWYSLIDKVWNPSHLRMAAWAVIGKDGAPGVDGQSCAQLEAHLEETVGELARLLRAERYEPRPVKRGLDVAGGWLEWEGSEGIRG